MPSNQDMQLEKVIDEACSSGDVAALDAFLQRNIVEEIPIKCSNKFLQKLDTFISGSLDENKIIAANLGLTALCKCGKNLKLPSGAQGIPGLIAQGLWVEKCRQSWIQCGPQWDETLFSLSLGVFDALMVAHEACKEGIYEVTELFLYPLGQLATDRRIYILIQKEAVQQFNKILDKIPVDLGKEKKFLSSQEASAIMIKLAGQILEGGDYDLQIALTEALCRMTTPQQRQQLAHRWFSMEYVASGFLKVHDADFETDCRKFLNLVNGMQGDRRRVYSYPCLEVYLDQKELLMPADERLEEFWIDFNLGSHSISFYFSLADEERQEGQWETLCITENDVKSYSITEKGKTQILQVELLVVMAVGAVEGSKLCICFSSALDILQAAHHVYGLRKNQGIGGKTSTSVVKTTVKVVMEENSSQVVPETQTPRGESEKNRTPYPFLTPSAQTPAKMKILESTTYVSGSTGRSAQGVLSADSSVKVKGKPPLEMVQSCNKQCNVDLQEFDKTSSHGTTPNSSKGGGMRQPHKQERADRVFAGQQKDQRQEEEFVPDTQTSTDRNFSSDWSKLSVSEMLMMPTQKINPLPKPLGLTSQKQLHAKLTERPKEVVKEKKKNSAPQQAAKTQKKMSRERSENSSSVDRCASAVHNSKKQRAQRHALNKGQVSLQADGVPAGAPIKASSSNIMQTKGTSNVQDKSKTALSSKEKYLSAQRDAVVAGCLVKHISNHYEMDSEFRAKAANIPQRWNASIVSRQIFNMSWVPSVKKTWTETISLKKSHSKSVTNSSKQRKDVFAFNTDSPLSIKGNSKSLSEKSACGNYCSSALHSTKKKGQAVTKETLHVRSHLFSSTDANNVSTEPSWLAHARKKQKPERSKAQIASPPTSDESPAQQALTSKPVKCNITRREKLHVRTHLFSSTDTDNVSTEPSWLKAARKKQKPKSSKAKIVSPPTSDESPAQQALSSKPVKRNITTNRKTDVEKTRKQPKEAANYSAAPDVPRAAGRRSQRAAAATAKNYREPDTDSSPSESGRSSTKLSRTEKTQGTAQTMKTNHGSYQKADINYNSSRMECVSEQPPVSKNYLVNQLRKKEKTYSGSPEAKKRKTDKQRTDALTRDNSYHSDMREPTCSTRGPLKDPWDACQASASPSPPLMERMRDAERSAPTLDLIRSPPLTPQGSPLPASPDPPSQDNPSPIPLLPKPHSGDRRKGASRPSSHSAGKKRKCSKTPSFSPLPSGRTTAPSAVESQRCPFPATLSPSPLPGRHPWTSTQLELDKPSMPSPLLSPFTESTVGHDRHNGPAKVAPLSQVSLSPSSDTSSALTRGVKEVHSKENTPLSDPDLKSAHLLVSGPTYRHHVLSSIPDDKENNRMSATILSQMKPRRLFKSYADAAENISSPLTGSSDHWEAEKTRDEIDVDEESESPDVAVNSSNLCQQFNAELKKRFQKRKMTVDFYSKQYLKTVGQHVSSVNTQIGQYRTQHIDEVLNVLSEEIHRLEQDETVLKNMAKDHSVYWTKQAKSFRSHCEQETRRSDTLKKALQSDVCHNLEYEEKIFTSQMCLIRKDMKSVQDRLLSRMQEAELQNVKRRLRTLFFPGGGRI